MSRSTILLVEDNLDEVQLMREALAGADAEIDIQVCGTVAEARSLLAQAVDTALPALLITDHHLPDGSGHELLALLQAGPPQRRLPAVMLSGDALRPSDLGGVAWFAKPDTWAGWRALAGDLKRLIGR